MKGKIKMENNKLDVRVYPIEEPKGNTKAFASVAIDDLIAIRGIRVVEGENGLFMTMPQSQDKKTEEYHDIAFPLTRELREEMNNAVVEEYLYMSGLPHDQRIYNKVEMDDMNGKNADDVSLDIRVFPLNNPQGSTKAFASVSIDDLVAIRGIRVVEGKNGVFMAMPQSKDKNGDHHDIAFPLNGELRKAINKAVIDQYNSPERSPDKKSSLGERLAENAQRAAQSTAPRAFVAKSHGGSVLE
jgi:stage V sporulation protein G